MGAGWEKGPSGELLMIETATPLPREKHGGLWTPGALCQGWLPLLALCSKDGFTFGVCWLIPSIKQLLQGSHGGMEHFGALCSQTLFDLRVSKHLAEGG